ncbi:MAG: IS1096 element passenger TnpR family protein [Blastocatellia bacterium]
MLLHHPLADEKRLPIEDKRTYPVCIAGRRAGPVEDCGGAQAFVERRAEAPSRVIDLIEEVATEVRADRTRVQPRYGLHRT